MMKKKYEKPQIAFEDMTLNTAIASCEAYYLAECTPIGDYGPQFVSPGGEIYVTEDTSICQNGEFFCYHVTAETVFNLTNRS